MNRVVRGSNELKIGSSILTRRGGTDANAPERPREAILRDRHVGILGPRILGNSGKCPTKNQISIDKLTETSQNPRKWVENWFTNTKFGCGPVPRVPGPQKQ